MFSAALNLGLLFVISLTGYLCQEHGAGEPGTICDSTFYDKVIRPASDAVDLMYKSLDTPDQIQSAENFKAAGNEMDVQLSKEVPAGTLPIDISHVKTHLLVTKGCSGLPRAYLQCDSARKVCACKTVFPFTLTERGGKCTGTLGSICAIEGQYELPCEGTTVCSPAGIGKARFCGGVEAFKKARTDAANAPAPAPAGTTLTAIINLPILLTSVVALIFH